MFYHTPVNLRSYGIRRVDRNFLNLWINTHIFYTDYRIPKTKPTSKMELTIVFVLGVLVLALVYFYKKKSVCEPEVPGLKPASEKDGNFGDIVKAGSFHQFLVNLHKQYGPIASFWYGPTYTVSIADEKLFKEHRHAFNRPEVLFNLFKDLIGPRSIQFANGEDWKARRHLYDRMLTYNACKKYFQIFQEVADKLVTQWKVIPHDQHIPVSQYMTDYALESVLVSLFGDTMTDLKEMRHFKQLYDVTWGEMESRLTTSSSTPERLKAFNEAKQEIYVFIRRIIEIRKKNPPSHGEDLFIDVLIENMDSDKEEQLINDTFTYVVGGFHTTGNTLTWAFYFLATHPDYQERLYKEITDVLKGEEVDHTNIGELVFLRQFIDETLRCGVIAPYAGRYQDVDTKLGGYTIPKETPVVHALGVTLVDERTWPDPKRFDPDRFSQENSKRRSNLAFAPFGFAGKRVCPGQRFSYQEVIVAMATLVRQFRMSYAGNENIIGVHGLVTHPSEEIWITLQER